MNATNFHHNISREGHGKFLHIPLPFLKIATHFFNKVFTAQLHSCKLFKVFKPWQPIVSSKMDFATIPYSPNQAQFHKLSPMQNAFPSARANRITTTTKPMIIFQILTSQNLPP
ncbi:hypothetical protein ACOSP7_025661 [Xanthoceras sorbifolium]